MHRNNLQCRNVPDSILVILVGMVIFDREERLLKAFFPIILMLSLKIICRCVFRCTFTIDAVIKIFRRFKRIMEFISAVYSK